MKNKKKNFLKLKDNFLKKRYILFIYMKVFIIAEVGINHNGSINLAKKLINVASKAGAMP